MAWPLGQNIGPEVVVDRRPSARSPDPRCRNHPLAVGRLERRRQQAPGQGAGRDNGPERAAVGQDMNVIFRRIGGVGRDRDAARRHDRDIGDQPFRAVLRNQHHAVARLQAHVDQAAGEVLDRLGGLAPAHGLVSAVALGPKEGLVAALVRLLEKEPGQARPILECHDYPRRPFWLAPPYLRGTLLTAFLLCPS